MILEIFSNLNDSMILWRRGAGTVPRVCTHELPGSPTIPGGLSTSLASLRAASSQKDSFKTSAHCWQRAGDGMEV